MKKLTLFFTLVVVALTACSGKKENGESSLKFETTVVENTIERPESKGEEDKMSYTIRFTYPSEFGDQKVLEKLNRNFIENTFGGNASGLSLDKAMDAVVDGWKNEYLAGDTDIHCMRGISDSILYVSDELLQYYVCAYEYNGGSNVSKTSFHLLSLQTGDEYKQADIFRPESANDIRQLVTSQIQSQEYTDPDWNMELAWTPETNFSVTDKGILIQYSNYELGTYRSPEEEILLPYKQILPYLNEGTPVYTLASK